jgi:hypothetical protein
MRPGEDIGILGGVLLTPFDARPTAATLSAWAPEIERVQKHYEKLRAGGRPEERLPPSPPSDGGSQARSRPEGKTEKVE